MFELFLGTVFWVCCIGAFFVSRTQPKNVIHSKAITSRIHVIRSLKAQMEESEDGLKTMALHEKREVQIDILLSALEKIKVRGLEDALNAEIIELQHYRSQKSL